MTKRAIRVALVVVIVVVVFFGIAYLRSRAPVAVGGSGAPSDITVTGTYADDWQANCGPLVAAAQSGCTARLDARYGRADGEPVPPVQGKAP